MNWLLQNREQLAQLAGALYALVCVIVGLLRVPRSGRLEALLHLLGRLACTTWSDAPGTWKFPGTAQPQHRPPVITPAAQPVDAEFWAPGSRAKAPAAPAQPAEPHDTQPWPPPLPLIPPGR